MSRMLSAITLACLLFGCSKKDEATNPNPPLNPGPEPKTGSTPTPKTDPGPKVDPAPRDTGPDLSKVDVTVTAEGFSKEYNTNAKAADTKYEGKVVEITGLLDYCQVTKTTRKITFLVPSDLNRYACTCMFRAMEVDKEEQLRAYSHGQRITVRGIAAGGPGLFHAKIVNAGASTTKVVTVKDIVAADKDKIKRKEYELYSVILRVQVVELGSKEKGYAAIVTDVGMTDGSKATLQLPPDYRLGFAQDIATDEILALKKGDVVMLLAELSPIDTEKTRLDYPRILKQPPTGIDFPLKK